MIIYILFFLCQQFTKIKLLKISALNANADLVVKNDFEQTIIGKVDAIITL